MNRCISPVIQFYIASNCIPLLQFLNISWVLCFHIRYKLFFIVILWSLFHILVSSGLNRYYICRAINSPRLQFCKQDNYNFRWWLLSTKRKHMPILSPLLSAHCRQEKVAEYLLVKTSNRHYKVSISDKSQGSNTLSPSHIRRKTNHLHTDS